MILLIQISRNLEFFSKCKVDTVMAAFLGTNTQIYVVRLDVAGRLNAISIEFDYEKCKNALFLHHRSLSF